LHQKKSSAKLKFCFHFHFRSGSNHFAKRSESRGSRIIQS